MSVFSTLRKNGMAAAVASLYLFLGTDAPRAQGLQAPTCSWGFQWTAFGLGNWLFPDTGNRWWYMPVDPQWQAVKINAAYPKARFFSFAVYDNAPASTGLADHIFDAGIAPDEGSINPFAGGQDAADGRQGYTISVSRNPSDEPNTLSFSAPSAWLVYRVYLPNGGEGAMGGVPLPKITVTDAAGRQQELPPCPVVNRQSELASLAPNFVPPVLESPPAVPQVADRMWFAPIPKPPARLLPNPDNKYMISHFMPQYQKGRVIVVRGKMPAFPDTYRGSSASVPAPGFSTVEMRYWSLCVASLVSPLPITGCAVDAATPLDADGFFTVVVTNDILRPDWLPAEDQWLPWGDEQMAPITIFIRNTLPSPGFAASAQAAIEAGCGVAFNFPVPPDPEAITAAGKCTREVMGDHYPVAVWCDKEAFSAKGWQGCFAAAGVE